MKKSKFLQSILSLALISSLSYASSNSDSTYYSFDTVKPKHEHKKDSHADHKAHWGYAGSEGPSYWGDLSTSNVDCKIGKRQSPIDIQTQTTQFGISDDGIYLDYNDVNLDILNNGHTIQVNISGDNEALINGKKYKLLQFHFHAPSEHTIDGKPIEMEAHLVHIAADGELAVIGVLMTQGETNSFIGKIFDNMPIDAHKGHNTTKSTTMSVNANDILPSSKAHWHYMGSLTTPPCTQIVQWYLLRQPITISSSQLAQFHKLYNGNARPTQELNKRVILQK